MSLETETELPFATFGAIRLAGQAQFNPFDIAAEGEGMLYPERMKPVALCTVNGVTSKVSGVCTHLGGVLGWNDAEQSWDCPLHGSRFSHDGRRLEGPALRDLEQVEAE